MTAATIAIAASTTAMGNSGEYRMDLGMFIVCSSLML
jgi:hypothetical protein